MTPFLVYIHPLQYVMKSHTILGTYLYSKSICCLDSNLGRHPVSNLATLPLDNLSLAPVCVNFPHLSVCIFPKQTILLCPHWQQSFSHS